MALKPLTTSPTHPTKLPSPPPPTSGRGWLNNDGEGEDEWAVKVFDGTESWTEIYAGSESRIYIIGLNKQAVSGACSHYAQAAISSSTTYIGVSLTNSLDYVRFRPDYTSFQTLADWTTYLAAQYAAGTPVTIVYKRATPAALTPTAAPLYALTAPDATEPVHNVTTSDIGSLTVRYARYIIPWEPSGYDGVIPAGAYYVSVDGSDANNGSSPGEAMRTIQAAIDAAAPHGLVVIGEGYLYAH